MDEKQSQERPGTTGEPSEKKKKETKRFRELMEWVIALAVALVVALFLTQVILVNAQVPSESMENTIQVGDRVIGFRLSYLFKEPQRGDIIIFKYPDDESQLYIKRVVGMPGEQVEVRDGGVYINGAAEPLDESYVKSLSDGGLGPDFGPEIVADDGYFVMGDNRGSSWDSRFWQNTYVHKEKIIGKGVCRIFPNPTFLQ